MRNSLTPACRGRFGTSFLSVPELAALVQSAGPGGLGLTPHDLRHTAAYLAIAAGANVKAVQRMLGHSSAAMTLDVYAGLFGDDLDSVAALLDSHGPQMRDIGEIEAPKGGHDDAA